MAHKFNPENWRRLESAERRAALPPPHVLDEIGLQRGQTMVDVGAGTGYFTVPAAPRVGPSGKIYAVDVSAEMLGYLAARIKGQALPVELIRSQETQVPLDDDIADHVFSSMVLHEVAPEARTAFLTEMARLAKSGGRLTVLDWAPADDVTMGPPSGERLPRSDVETLFQSANVRVTRSEPFGSHFYLVQGKATRRAGAVRRTSVPTR